MGTGAPFDFLCFSSLVPGQVRPSDPSAPGARGAALPDAEQSIGEAGAVTTQGESGGWGGALDGFRERALGAGARCGEAPHRGPFLSQFFSQVGSVRTSQNVQGMGIGEAALPPFLRQR